MFGRNANLAAVLVAMFSLAAFASDPNPARVTVDNFCRAETDMYFGRFAKEGGFGKFHHERNLASIDHQTVVRLNRDTVYSMGVFDLKYSPVKVTLPDAGPRFMSMEVINEDHYALDVLYKPGPYVFTQAQVGTRYVCFAIRTFVNPNDADDVKAVHALQDAIQVEQNLVGKFEQPQWDAVSQTKIRNALIALADANGGLDSARMFGRKDQVDEVQHLLGTAAGWGGNPQSAAYYVGVVPRQNDGTTVYRLTVKDVPVDGFWSISVYNKDGYFVKNARNAYTLNNVTAKPNADGSVTVQFGGCDGDTPNCLPIMPEWNYLVRLYRPRKAILDETWRFPDAQPVK